jgi:acetyltransferase-like isoleucine patch superfamily enzyme
MKILILKIIKFLPINMLKISLLKLIFGYKIGKGVKIGKSIINCKEVSIGNNVYIADRNVFSCEEIKIGDNTKIHSGNRFIGKSKFVIGQDSRIINDHYFDLWENITIGNNTWIAGKNSELWTHGSLNTKTKNKDLSIQIGNDVYIGSSSKVAPGVRISSVNLISLASMVVGVFDESRTIIMGNPASVVKNNIDWRDNW